MRIGGVEAKIEDIAHRNGLEISLVGTRVAIVLLFDTRYEASVFYESAIQNWNDGGGLVLGHIKD